MNEVQLLRLTFISVAQWLEHPTSVRKPDSIAVAAGLRLFLYPVLVSNFKTFCKLDFCKQAPDPVSNREQWPISPIVMRFSDDQLFMLYILVYLRLEVTSDMST